ncbi:unnamed protein product [Diabrotica balteata]|uniref:Uncharacterized protein n=1 Tax=Diabrotica balteata TaxID=107213 RepID=A0A9N9SQ02_DIABA|nr:unnamed protein product [Diabrotica balteata]
MACGDCGPCGPCFTSPCSPPIYPHAICCMSCPPPILLPTKPEPVEPLQMPCPIIKDECIPEEVALQKRYHNFYNAYNEDWHCITPSNRGPKQIPERGKKPKTNCEDYLRRRKSPTRGCPTGFQPCYMKLSPPCNNHPCGIWVAEIQKCLPKPKKSNEYVPGPCTRPCCMHKPCSEQCCCYDFPCKAHCYDHPVGIKPKHPLNAYCPR